MLDAYCALHARVVEDRLRLLQTACDAVLHYAHQNLIVHCDLKPSNIRASQDRIGADVAGAMPDRAGPLRGIEYPCAMEDDAGAERRRTLPRPCFQCFTHP